MTRRALVLVTVVTLGIIGGAGYTVSALSPDDVPKLRAVEIVDAP